jgi:hypothetical protein
VFIHGTVRARQSWCTSRRDDRRERKRVGRAHALVRRVEGTAERSCVRSSQARSPRSRSAACLNAGAGASRSLVRPQSARQRAARRRTGRDGTDGARAPARPLPRRDSSPRAPRGAPGTASRAPARSWSGRMSSAGPGSPRRPRRARCTAYLELACCSCGLSKGCRRPLASPPLPDRGSLWAGLFDLRENLLKTARSTICARLPPETHRRREHQPRPRRPLRYLPQPARPSRTRASSASRRQGRQPGRGGGAARRGRDHGRRCRRATCSRTRRSSGLRAAGVELEGRAGTRGRRASR